MARAATLLTKGELAQRVGVSPLTLSKALQNMAEAGVEIPSEGEGRTERYRLGAVKIVKDYRANRETRKPGRPPGAAKAFPPSPMRVTPSSEPLRLSDEDRALLRELADALRDIAGNLRAVGMNLNAVESELAAKATPRKAPAKAAKKTARKKAASKAPQAATEGHEVGNG